MMKQSNFGKEKMRILIANKQLIQNLEFIH